MITEEKSKLDEDIQFFADELKKCFSEVEIEEIARETGFVKEMVKLKHVNSFVYAALWMLELLIIHWLPYVQDLVQK